MKIFSFTGVMDMTRRTGIGYGLLWSIVLMSAGLSGEVLYISEEDELRDLDAGPGDEIIWRDGVYIDRGINLNFRGSEDAPLVFRAETPGGVVFKGDSYIRIGGDYITISGFHFYNGDDYYRETGSSVIQFRSNNGNVHAHHCRVTQCAIIDMNSWEQDVDDDDEDGDTTELIFHNSKWIQLYGTNHRIDHCYFAKKKTRGALIIAELVPQDGEDGIPYEAYSHHLDHNFFGPVPEGFSGNEFETIRLGTSDYANFNGNMVVANNYFYRCNGEIEVVSNKSSNNIYRNNLFVGCRGSLVIRHGDNCTIEGNIILGMGEADSGGIRVNGEGHRITSNYVSGTRGTGLRAGLCLRAAGGVETGDTDGGYEQVRFALIAFNTFYDITQPLNLGESGSKDNKYPPSGCVIANNLIYSERGTLVSWDKEPVDMTYEGNLVFGSSTGLSSEGFIHADPLLEADGWGLFRPGSESPALQGSAGEYASVGNDLHGNPRPAVNADIGADQRHSGDVPLAPMAPASVGPDWIRGGYPVEMKAVSRTPSGQLEIRFSQKQAIGLGSFGLEISTDLEVWRPVQVFVEGPDNTGVFSIRMDEQETDDRFWRVVNR